MISINSDQTKKRNGSSWGRSLFHQVLVILGAAAFTLATFLVLPLMQTISSRPATDLVVQQIDTAALPPPPPPPEPEVEKEPEPEEKPPELVEEAPPLDLSQLELALNPGFNEGWMGGDFKVELKTIAGGSQEDLDALFSLSDLDQKPRAIYQPGPVFNDQTRKKAPGTVYVIFLVDKNGRVDKPKVQKSSDPVFEAPAMSAVKQWKFEPGMRNGKPVAFRMVVPISFPKG